MSLGLEVMERVGVRGGVLGAVLFVGAGVGVEGAAGVGFASPAPFMAGVHIPSPYD